LIVLDGWQQSPNQVTRLQAFGDSEVIITSANRRLVTERPSLNCKGKIFCTKRSPEIAVAFQKATALAASGGAPQGPSASASANISSSETTAQLAGRTGGVLALRDDLYYICQGHANGTFNKTDFAMALSQYGKLVVALVGNPLPSSGSPGQFAGPSPSSSSPSSPGAGSC
jgi:hypothetical protein